jgi:hypothetical protein
MVGLIVSALFTAIILSCLWRDRRNQPEPVQVRVPSQSQNPHNR